VIKKNKIKAWLFYIFGYNIVLYYSFESGLDSVGLTRTCIWINE